MKEKELVWVVWDATENKEVFRAVNGVFAEAMAKKVKEETGHRIILGTEVSLS